MSNNNREVLANAIKTLKSINHDLRCKIISHIQSVGEATVTEIQTKHRLEQSITSQHLSRLRKAGVVNTRRAGKLIYYSVNAGRIRQIQNIAASFG